MVLIAHARGGDPSYTPGDNSGGEVRTQQWYDSNWDFVLRPKSSYAAQKAAFFAQDICRNDEIGYSQVRRNNLRNAALKLNWQFDKVKRPCDCDCSSMVAACYEAAGIPLDRPYGNAPYTGNMQLIYLKTGSFDLLKDEKFLRSDKYLLVGDVLVVHHEKGDKKQHTAIVITDGDLSKPHTHESTEADVKCGETVIYTIVPGDTLWAIALAHKTSVSAICETNSIKESDIIYPGQKLVLPT